MSTIQVDRIIPYQSASVTIDGDIVQANAATTGSNTFVGSQTINGTLYLGDGGGTPAELYANTITDYNVVINKDLRVTGTITSSLQQGYVVVGGVGNVSTLVATSSFGGGGGVVGAATTGSNTFTGDQTLIDAAGNTITLSDASGSLMLVAKTFTSASSHLTASAGNQVNLIFKNNDNTADTIISGSNNIFTNPTAAGTTFKRVIGSNNIVNSATGMPQITGSSAATLAITSNYFGTNAGVIRATLTGSTYTITNNIANGTINLGGGVGAGAMNDFSRAQGATVNGNLLNGTLSFFAGTVTGLPIIATIPTATTNIINGFTTATMNSSSIALGTNIISSPSLIITNNYFSGSAGSGSLSLNGNLVGGRQNTTILVQGSNPAGTVTAPSIGGNIIYGAANAIHINADNSRTSGTTLYASMEASAVIGNTLAVTGSSVISDLATVGSAFVGRFNANDGIRNKTSDVVFAVGTGTATGTRKTGLLVDSGSNTFVEGTLNVSGSSSFTGSVSVSGTSTQTFTAPSTESEIPLITLNGAVVGGTPFNNVRMLVQDYASLGQTYTEAIGFEYFDSLSYNFGSEFTLNGKEINLQVFPTGSGGVGGQFRILDNGSSKAISDWNATEIYIGTSLSRSTDFIRMGNTGLDYIRLTSQKNEITGSVSLSSTLQLAGQDPLPTGAVGQLAVSASNLYYHNGSSWTQIN